jgi:tetrahydromethanopterin S-methyltransferase subunit A
MNEWPVVDGDFTVGDPAGCVAVCVLTSAELKAPLAAIPEVAIAGTLQTANLGVERVVRNVTANPSIRFLLVCGKESKLFQPGDALVALRQSGFEPGGRIAGTGAFEPLLKNLAPLLVEHFRTQVELVDRRGETAAGPLREVIAALAARNPGAHQRPDPAATAPPVFKPLRPGGDREPLRYDPKGYFVILIEAPEILIRHYSPGHAPLHEMRGRNPSSLLLGLLREGLVSQLSHAGYLGIELAKAQLAIKAGVAYEQDRPLAIGAGPVEFNAAVEVGAVEGTTLTAIRLEPDPASPHDTFRRTRDVVSARWSGETRIAMGEWEDVQPGAVVRVRGSAVRGGPVDATTVVVLTRVAKLVETATA